MPEISRFLGIVIRMFVKGAPGGRMEHAPAHFHAIYGKSEEKLYIETLKFAPVKGKASLPGRVRGLVIEWAEMHTEELLADWEMAQNNQSPLPPIPGLE